MIYLVIIDLYDTEENSIVNICSNRKIAEQLVEQYTKESNGFTYHIDEVDPNSSEDILWDCYKNSIFS